MLGKREPEVYGSDTLEDIQKYTAESVQDLKVSLDWKQSNIEGEIVDMIQNAVNDGTEGLIINPAAFSHTSVAIHDALKLLKIPKIEVHLSNTNHREEFRQIKLTAKSCDIIMEGLKRNAYCVAIVALTKLK